MISKSPLIRAAIVACGALLAVAGFVPQAQANVFHDNLCKGCNNDAFGVYCAQRAINDEAMLDGYGRPLAEDGIFGPSTYDWVAWYQGDLGLTWITSSGLKRVATSSEPFTRTTRSGTPTATTICPQ